MNRLGIDYMSIFDKKVLRPRRWIQTNSIVLLILFGFTFSAAAELVQDETETQDQYHPFAVVIADGNVNELATYIFEDTNDNDIYDPGEELPDLNYDLQIATAFPIGGTIEQRSGFSDQNGLITVRYRSGQDPGPVKWQVTPSDATSTVQIHPLWIEQVVAFRHDADDQLEMAEPQPADIEAKRYVGLQRKDDDNFKISVTNEPFLSISAYYFKGPADNLTLEVKAGDDNYVQSNQGDPSGRLWYEVQPTPNVDYLIRVSGGISLSGYNLSVMTSEGHSAEDLPIENVAEPTPVGPTWTPTITPTHTTTATQTDTPTFTGTNTPTETPTGTSTPTDTPTITPTGTIFPTDTNTPTATDTPTATETPDLFGDINEDGEVDSKDLFLLSDSYMMPTNTPTGIATATPTVIPGTIDGVWRGSYEEFYEPDYPLYPPFKKDSGTMLWHVEPDGNKFTMDGIKDGEKISASITINETAYFTGKLSMDFSANFEIYMINENSLTGIYRGSADNMSVYGRIDLDR